MLLYAQTVATVLLRRPLRRPAWPALASGALVVAETVQVALGQSRVIAPHMPLGMAIFGASALLTVWA